MIFFTRDLLSKLANRQYVLICLLEAPLLALILSYFTKDVGESGYIFSANDNLPSYLFMCVITSMFLGLIISAEEIVKDRKILKRESFLNLSWFSYVNSKILLMFIISAIQTFSFILVGNSILEIRGMTISYWLILFTTSCLANLIGLNISSAFNSIITIYILIPFIIIPQLLFSGVLVNFDKLHRISQSPAEFVPVIGDLMPTRWSFEALAVEQFKNNKYEKNIYEFNLEVSQNNWYTGFLISNLRIDLQDCKIKINIDSVKYADIIRNKLSILQYHLEDLSVIAQFGSVPKDLIESLTPEHFNPAAEKRAGMYLDSLYDKFMQIINTAWAKKDGIVKDQKYIFLKDLYYNSRLENHVLNRLTNDKKIVKTNKKYIQKGDPAYMKPVSKFGRAHFYAPYKLIGNQEIDTFWFNIIVLWIVSLIFYIILYYKTLRKLITFFEKK